MEYTAVFEERVPLTPKDLRKEIESLDAILLEKLSARLENKCSRHGFVKPDTLEILSRSMGYIEKGRYTGDVVYHIQAQGKVYNPPSGFLLEGIVIRKNKMGMYVSFEDAIRIILPRDLHIGNEEFEEADIGSLVKVEIQKSRFQVNDPYILSVGIFRGIVKKDAVQLDANCEPADGKIKAAEETLNINIEERLEGEEDEEEEEETLEPILFYSKKPEYREFSNFFVEPFKLEDPTPGGSVKLWPSVEHYFQAAKFPNDPVYREKIRTAATPEKAKLLGGNRAKKIDPQWDSKREDVMRKALYAKFSQNEVLRNLLLSTGNRDLIEDSPTDSYWGRGNNGTGSNRLGVLLMELRSTLRKEDNE
jgi:ribA/ribD-fused uncharacterized protein